MLHQPGDYIEVMPAYGRDYKNQKEIVADLKDGKDFQMTDTRQYINIDEMRKNQFRVIIRYGKLMKVMDASKYIK